jgi:hypothetical protein
MTNPKTNKRVPNSNSSLLGIKDNTDYEDYYLVQFLLVLFEMDRERVNHRKKLKNMEQATTETNQAKETTINKREN